MGSRIYRKSAVEIFLLGAGVADAGGEMSVER